MIFCRKWKVPLKRNSMVRPVVVSECRGVMVEVEDAREMWEVSNGSPSEYSHSGEVRRKARREE